MCLVDDLEIELSHEFSPMRMTTVELSSLFHEIFELLVVSIYDRREISSFELVTSFFEGRYDRRKFFVMDFVVQLPGVELS